MRDQAPSAWLVAAGVGAACLSGVAYALLGVVIRYAVTDRISIPLTLVSVTLTGVIALGAVAVLRIGVSGMLATVPEDFWTMMLAGFFNAVAFLALATSLQLIPVVYVNALSATQAAMAALAGILMFSERSSSALWFGVVMTVVGLLMMQRKSTRKSLGTEMENDGDRTDASVKDTPQPAPALSPQRSSDRMEGGIGSELELQFLQLAIDPMAEFFGAQVIQQRVAALKSGVVQFFNQRGSRPWIGQGFGSSHRSLTSTTRSGPLPGIGGGVGR